MYSSPAFLYPCFNQLQPKIYFAIYEIPPIYSIVAGIIGYIVVTFGICRAGMIQCHSIYMRDSGNRL